VISDNIEARVIALELIMRGFIVDAALNNDDPIAQLSDWRDGAIGALAKLQSATNPDAQNMLSAASEALQTTFDGAQVQLQQLLQE
jgi:hypothetical protein